MQLFCTHRNCNTLQAGNRKYSRKLPMIQIMKIQNNSDISDAETGIYCIKKFNNFISDFFYWVGHTIVIHCIKINKR